MILEFIKIYKQNPLEIFFFTIYQNYTLALMEYLTKNQWFSSSQLALNVQYMFSDRRLNIKYIHWT